MAESNGSGRLSGEMVWFSVRWFEGCDENGLKSCNMGLGLDGVIKNRIGRSSSKRRLRQTFGWSFSNLIAKMTVEMVWCFGIWKQRWPRMFASYKGLSVP